jgi:hypothetical protein
MDDSRLEPRYPRPNWFVFNRISLLPAVGIGGIVAGVIKHTPWLIPVGVATAVVGTWLTMRRLTGRISERSLVWVLIETTAVLAASAVVFALHLSGVVLFVTVAVPTVVSESVATALTGVREAS